METNNILVLSCLTFFFLGLGVAFCSIAMCRILGIKVSEYVIILHVMIEILLLLLSILYIFFSDKKWFSRKLSY